MASLGEHYSQREIKPAYTLLCYDKSVDVKDVNGLMPPYLSIYGIPLPLQVVSIKVQTVLKLRRHLLIA